MPINLTGSKVKDTYSQLLHVDGGPAASEKVVYSGTGVATALKVGTGSISVENIKIDGNTISSTDTNGDITIAPNGTGSVILPKVAITAGTVPYSTITNRAYASFSDITDQTGSTTVAPAVKFGTVEVAGAGITMVTDGANLTRLTFAEGGTYAVAPNLQFANSSATDHAATIWFALDGTNIPRSTTKISVPRLSDGGVTFFQIVLYVTVTAGQYVQLFWLPDNVAVTLDHIAAVTGPPAVPAVPSAIVSAERIA